MKQPDIDFREVDVAAVRGVLVGTMVVVTALGMAGTSSAVPPPPPHPSDAEIAASRAAADRKAAEVGELTSRLTRAEARLSELRGDLELKLERANKALVDLEIARGEADQAEARAAAARRESETATVRVEQARTGLDRFIAAGFESSGMLGSIPAYLSAENPRDLLDRAELLSSVSRYRLNALRLMEQAQVEKANADAAARKAAIEAQEKREAAVRAERDAEAARAAAEAAEQSQAAETARLEADRSAAERELFAAQQRVEGLREQRQRYDGWLAQKQRDEERAARLVSAGPSAAPAQPAGRGGAPAPAGSRAATLIEQVVARAMSQVGVPYAWGGGNANGPTRGIRDGGVADRHGDYNKIGFDCSGLMVYAFAGVVQLPHYSGYQYNAGPHVRISEMRRGDLLFWGLREIYHVALYLGDGMMIEAPESGKTVRVTPVRYGDLLPYVTRLIS